MFFSLFICDYLQLTALIRELAGRKKDDLSFEFPRLFIIRHITQSDERHTPTYAANKKGNSYES